MLKQTIERLMSERRVTRPMERRDLAEMSGVTSKRLLNIMKNPGTAKLHELVSIAQALGVTHAELVSGDIKEPTTNEEPNDMEAGD